jgi:hypothetical protein
VKIRCSAKVPEALCPHFGWRSHALWWAINNLGILQSQNSMMLGRRRTAVSWLIVRKYPVRIQNIITRTGLYHWSRENWFPSIQYDREIPSRGKEGSFVATECRSGFQCPRFWSRHRNASGRLH